MSLRLKFNIVMVAVFLTGLVLAGIFASGQTYEQLILHLLAHPLPEARRYGAMILEELKVVMPSFVARVDRPDLPDAGPQRRRPRIRRHSNP